MSSTQDSQIDAILSEENEGTADDKVSSSESGSEHHTASKPAKTIDLVFLGIVIVIGGDYFSWNLGLTAGFWNFFIALLLTAVGYFCLTQCLAEMTGTLPFSGGAYGFVRVALGPYLGFCAGCCEFYQNCFYISASVLPLGQMITDLSNGSKMLEPLYWFLFLAFVVVIQVCPTKTFWHFNLILGIISAVILLIYIFGSLHEVNFDKYATERMSGSESGAAFMRILPLATWCFIGVESIPLGGSDCETPKDSMPKALTISMPVLFAFALVTVFVAASHDPGIVELSKSTSPLSYGFRDAFGITAKHAIAFSLPATFATIYGFLFAVCRQMSSMSASGLLPTFIKARPLKWSRTPVYALLIACLVSYLLSLAVWLGGPDLSFGLFLSCCLGSYLVYILMLISYIMFKAKYSNLPRAYQNPLGVSGAIIGILIFALCSIACSAFDPFYHAPLVVVVLYIIFISIVYYLRVKTSQFFSEDEQKVMFKAYIINANLHKKPKNKKSKGRSGSNASSTAGLPLKRSSKVGCSANDIESNASTAGLVDMLEKSIVDHSPQLQLPAENNTDREDDNSNENTPKIDVYSKNNSFASGRLISETIAEESNLPVDDLPLGAEARSLQGQSLDSVKHPSLVWSGSTLHKDMLARGHEEDYVVVSETITSPTRLLTPMLSRAMTGIFHSGSHSSYTIHENSKDIEREEITHNSNSFSAHYTSSHESVMNSIKEDDHSHPK